MLAWKNKNPQAIASLCSEKFSWHETPFAEPLITHEQLLKEWSGVLDQKDLNIQFEILCVNKDSGVARWKASFVSISTGKKITYDGIYWVLLDDLGKCQEFWQWFNSKEG